jgi:hypothetical protein
VSRTALFEWIAVAVLLLGCALVTAGVITITFDGGIAAILIVAGGVLAAIGAVVWTLVVKAGTRRRTA